MKRSRSRIRNVLQRHKLQKGIKEKFININQLTSFENARAACCSFWVARAQIALFINLLLDYKASNHCCSSLFALNKKYWCFTRSCFRMAWKTRAARENSQRRGCKFSQFFVLIMAEAESDLLGIVCLAAVWGITNVFISNAARQDKAESKGCWDLGWNFFCIRFL
jgi:hypothetical protein